MPIRPEHRILYPADWPELSAAVRFVRARGRCEHCGRPHGRLVRHLGDGRWWDEDARTWRDGSGRSVRCDLAPAEMAPRVRRTRVVLATAHLDHNPTNSAKSNLAALCQRCHLANDRPEHVRRRRLTAMRLRAMADLFEGPYQR